MSRMELGGKTICVVLNDDLSLAVSRPDGPPTWEGSKSQNPTIVASAGGGGFGESPTDYPGRKELLDGALIIRAYSHS